MNEKIIKVFDTTRNYAIDASVGNVIYNKISEALKTYDKVILDFKNVDIILSVFLNAAISGFYNKQEFENFEAKVSVQNISDSAQILWNRVIQSAKRKLQNN